MKTPIELLEKDFWELTQAPGKVRLWLIKRLFPEFSKFVALVKDNVFWNSDG